jgi:hypothetical protein
MPQVIPQTGLIGYEQALMQGLQGQMDALDQGYNQAYDVMSPFSQGGAEASQLQAAQSGAMGADAQAQAFQNFTASPGQQYLQGEAERALMRNASRAGGLGGGNVLRELQSQAVGLAQQDFQNQFNRLGQVSASGQNAAGAQANILGQQGASVGQAIGNTGNNLAQGRYNTGQQIAQAASGTTSSLANLQNQLGTGMANQFGQGSTNLANTVSGYGSGSSALQQNLATILANIGTGGASQAANYTNLAGQFDASGTLGQNTAVQNTLSQLMQMVPQSGTTQATPTYTPSGYGYGVGGGSNANQLGVQFSGTAGQQVA